REQRRLIQQTNTHTQPLRPLTRKHKHRTTNTTSNTLHHTQPQPTNRTTHPNTTNTSQQTPTIAPDHNSAILELRPMNQRKRHIHTTDIPTPRNTLSQATRLTTQPQNTTPRQHPRHHTTTQHRNTPTNIL